MLRFSLSRKSGGFQHELHPEQLHLMALATSAQHDPRHRTGADRFARRRGSG